MQTHFPKQINFTGVLMIFITLSIFTFLSCNKEEIDNSKDSTPNTTPVVNDNYYVKYVISSSYPYIFSNWTVTTPEGNYTKNDYQTRYWEQTYGPVKKGFKCDVQVKNGQPTIKIYVSKNQEPFSLKESKEGYSATYTIAF